MAVCHVRPTIQLRLRNARVFHNSGQAANYPSNRPGAVLAACAAPRRVLHNLCAANLPDLLVRY
eukprot:5287783-Prymnesium_polylepis.1